MSARPPGSRAGAPRSRLPSAAGQPSSPAAAKSARPKAQAPVPAPAAAAAAANKRGSLDADELEAELFGGGGGGDKASGSASPGVVAPRSHARVASDLLQLAEDTVAPPSASPPTGPTVRGGEWAGLPDRAAPASTPPLSAHRSKQGTPIAPPSGAPSKGATPRTSVLQVVSDAPAGGRGVGHLPLSVHIEQQVHNPAQPNSPPSPNGGVATGHSESLALAAAESRRQSRMESGAESPPVRSGAGAVSDRSHLQLHIPQLRDISTAVHIDQNLPAGPHSGRMDVLSPTVRGTPREAFQNPRSVLSPRALGYKGPLDQSNWWTILTLSFLGPILTLGNKRQLQQADVPMLSRDDATPEVVRVFSRVWEKWVPKTGGGGGAGGSGGGQHAARRTSSPLTRTLLGCYGWSWFIGAICTMIGRWSLILTPLLIREFLHWVSSVESDSGTKDGFIVDVGSGKVEYGVVIILLLVFIMILSSLLVNHAYYQGVRIGCAYRTALMSLIFEKSLRCPNGARVVAAAPTGSQASRAKKQAAAAGKAKVDKSAAGAASGGGSTGQTVNLMANDTQLIFDASTFIHFVYVEPLLTIGTVAVLWWQIGIAALAAGGLMFALLPVQIAVARRIGRNRSQMVRHTDSRVKILSEILQGIRVIKLYAWEVPMAEKIQEVRLKELACVKRALLLKSFNLLTLFLWPVVVSMVTFIVYVSLGNRLTVTMSITILAFVNVLARPITVLPMALISVAEVRVSIARIEKFLLQDELQKIDRVEDEFPMPLDQHEGGDDGHGPHGGALVSALPANERMLSGGAGRGSNGGNGHNGKPSTPSAFSATGVQVRVAGGGGSRDTPSSMMPLRMRSVVDSQIHASSHVNGGGGGRISVEIRDGSFAWDRTSPVTLAGINLSIGRGKLVGIIGSVGAGKSSLLAAMLGEMHPVTGTVAVRGRVGFMSQSPWIQNCTVRDNILFGLPFDPVKYHDTLVASCLLADLSTFGAGDQTEIGERGITMSGGQKARVALARAVYRAHLCDLYLMDDPFAAVDVHVGTSMFMESVAGILRHKTRVLVLNSHLHLLQHFDEVIVIEADAKKNNIGGIAARGSFKEMEAKYPALLAREQLKSQVNAAGAIGSAPTAALVEIKEEDTSYFVPSAGAGRNQRRRTSVELAAAANRKAHPNALGVADSGSAFVPLSEGGSREVSRANSAAGPHKSPSARPAAAAAVLNRSRAPSDAAPSGDLFRSSPAPNSEDNDELPPFGSNVSPGTANDELGLPRQSVSYLPVRDASEGAPGKRERGRSAAKAGVADISLPGTPPSPDPTRALLASASPPAASPTAPAPAAAAPAAPVSLMTKEDRAQGSVGFHLYRYYFDMAAMGRMPDLLDVETENDGGKGHAKGSLVPRPSGQSVASVTDAKHAPGLQMSAAAVADGSVSTTPTGGAHTSEKQSMTLALKEFEAHDAALAPLDAAEEPEAVVVDVEKSGRVKSTTYAGISILVGILSLFLLCQALRIACDLWLTYWGREEADNAPEEIAAREAAGEDLPTENPTWFWIVGCAVLSVVTFSFVVLRAWLFVKLALRVSERMHRTLFRKLLLAPITTFYDVTPLGRILNRFSKDFDQVDSFCPDLMSQLMQHSFNLLGGLTLNVVSTPYYLLVLAPIFFAFHKLQQYFRVSSRELKRLEGVTRSPIFSMFGETLLGLSTIRAFRAEESFIQLQRQHISQNAKIYTSFYLTSRWLSLRLDFISNFLILAVGAFGLFLRDSMDTGLIGLALLYTLQFTGFLQWTVRVSVDTENSMTSVERLSHYNNLPSEAPYVVPIERNPPEGWPSKGEITFNNLRMRYRPELPWILKGVSCSIRPREKIGICGRTGSGKSSLMVSLFRLVESPTRGAIVIDGIDIGTIGLLNLRSALSIIPQDPVMFSGTIRHNLDPFDEKADSALWVALGQVSLQSFVLSLPGGLDATVAEYGDNFSSGQKQLICIARALLRQSKIIVLDEATAAVDNETDATIQRTIRDSFADCTVLTIAHRLNTIMDSTRVMVLDNGYLAEFDTPHNLLSRPDGIFYNMVKKANGDKQEEAH